MLIKALSLRTKRPRRDRSVGHRGFTLVELIIVIVMLGILAVYAAPRIFDRSDFDARGFHDETMAVLRYAQKAAIAQRRTVCVTVASTCPTDATKLTTTMTVFTQNPATSTCASATIVSCAAPMAAGQTCLLPSPFNPKCGTGLLGTPAAFAFTPEGRTDTTGIANTPVAVAITGTSSPITVEASTGYVHD